ncbi:MAG: trimethylamine methyltransferase family protein [Desulfosarcina sp.]|nr:trimethylamine methyltransferase family protein [Desulfosarcina sp.]MBC2766313.1 hypothetical protein [Desulfosarcina sp.]
MMINRAIINFDKSILDQIHNRSLELLQDCGIRFPSEKALEVFRSKGFRANGQTVYFEEKAIIDALGTVPAQFTIKARNPEKSICIGGGDYMMAPGYGPPFIIETTGEKRDATLEDVHKFCKLVQTSKCLDFNSSIVVQPNDVPTETAHLDILLGTILLTDKPLMGSTSSEVAALDSLRLAEKIWGNTNDPVMISLVDSLSPLQYADESVESLMVYAKAGQPVVVHSACSLGTTGPITIAGSLVISNATTLAGICLSQLLNPGTPIVYGLGGSPTEMRTGGYVNASPEDAKHTAIVTALARYYGIPCRSQGALTESFCLDYQAGMDRGVFGRGLCNGSDQGTRHIGKLPDAKPHHETVSNCILRTRPEHPGDPYKMATDGTSRNGQTGRKNPGGQAFLLRKTGHRSNVGTGSCKIR